MNPRLFDSLARWFDAAESLGEFVGIRFGRIAIGKNQPDWLFMSHTEFDGIGGFAEILRRRGATIERLPQIKHAAAASRLALLRMLPRFLSPRHRIQWQLPDKKAKDGSQPARALAWHAFDEAFTSRLREYCHKNETTINTFLLVHLTNAIRPFLKIRSATIPWMIPVNLRGRIARTKDTANSTSYVSVNVNAGDEYAEVHRKIGAAMDRKEHWANWFAFDLARVTTHRIRMFLIERELATSQWNIGAFSNLGDWDTGSLIRQDACQGVWLFCPPVLRFQKIGVGCVTFQNRLSLSIQAHPELTDDPDVTEAWMKAWMANIGLALLA